MPKPLLRPLVTTDGNELLFDARPIELAGFRLEARQAVPVGVPTLKEWANALRLASAAEESSPYWIGDLCAYAESRADWREKLSQAMSVTGLAEQTLHNYASMCRRVELPERKMSPSPSHSMEVAPMPREEQTEWLTKARTEGWTRRDLQLNIQASKRRKVIDGQAELEGTYRVIYADPPWAYNNRGDIKVGKSSAYKRAEAHYPTLTIDRLCKLPVTAHTRPNSVLFLWVTSPMLMGNPGPREVIEAWGFEYKSSFVWDKVLGNFGHYNHVCHELLLVCTRGRCLPDRPTPQPKSVITERRSDQHSGKPASVRTMIEKLYDGPYLELFAREKVEGWTCWGNDARLWPAQTEVAV